MPCSLYKSLQTPKAVDWRRRLDYISIVPVELGNQ